MKNLLGKIVVIGMAVFMSLSIRAIPVNASCSGWTTYIKCISYCDDSQGCGFLWQQDTKKHKEYQERYCDEGGVQVRKTRITYKKDGCC